MLHDLEWHSATCWLVQRIFSVMPSMCPNTSSFDHPCVSFPGSAQPRRAALADGNLQCVQRSRTIEVELS